MFLGFDYLTLVYQMVYEWMESECYTEIVFLVSIGFKFNSVNFEFLTVSRTVFLFSRRNKYL